MPPETPASNQFDFIKNADKKPKRLPFSLPNGSLNQRIAVFAGIVVVLFAFFFFIMAMAGRGGEDKVAYIRLIQKQNELVRVAAFGTGNQTTNADLKNTASNVHIVVSSDKQALITTLTNKKMKFKNKELSGKPNANTTKLLNDAKAAGNFDSTFITTLNEHLTDYRAALDQTYNQTRSRSIREALSNAYKNADFLQKRLEATKP